MSEREKFSSRLGFLLIAAGCAIGLGNVWRFPFITGENGGALFVLLYVFFLVTLGVPLLMVELAIGRASRRSLARSYQVLEAPGARWHKIRWAQIAGNYILMSFYGLITGWLLYYSLRFLFGGFGEDLTQERAGAIFGELLADPTTMTLCMAVCSLVAFCVVVLGVVRGVERVTKPMMMMLFVLLFGMALYAATLPGFREGIGYYLMPSLEGIEKNGLFKVLWAAMGQAFFTLSLGIGAIEIFGTYASRERTLLTEATWIAVLDTTVAFLAGMFIFPVCFSFGVQPSAGPGLLFVTLTTAFSHMEHGVVVGAVFFAFMLFAAMSTLITVYENLVAMVAEEFDVSRRVSTVINFVIVSAMSMPVLLGFNVLDFIHPMGGGSTILDLQDFLVSNNILPLGSLVFLVFVISKRGMGWDRFLAEVNDGAGPKIPAWAVHYYRVVPLTMTLAVLLAGYVTLFG